VREQGARNGWGVAAATLTMGLLVALVAAAGFVGYLRQRDPLPTDIDLSENLPAAVALDEPGRLVLDVVGADLTIRPAPAGDPLRITGSYDAAASEFEPAYSTHGEAGWAYRLRLGPNGMVQGLASRAGSHVEIGLPADVPIVVEGSFGGADAEIELGGLWIVRTDLELVGGDHRIAFSKPLLEPMESLSLEAPRGELTLVELGNASPVDVRIVKESGDACVDLRGAWQADTRLVVDCRIGTCDLHRPREDDAWLSIDGDAGADQEKRPVIELTATTRWIGSVEVSESLPGS
jgi:hypothetical protein